MGTWHLMWDVRQREAKQAREQSRAAEASQCKGSEWGGN